MSVASTDAAVCQEGAGSYFSWLFRGRSSKKRYNVSRRVKKPGAAANNNHIYRQTRYRHIAENSRNSAVIPTKIAKRTSTASSYNVSGAFIKELYFRFGTLILSTNSRLVRC